MRFRLSIAAALLATSAAIAHDGYEDPSPIGPRPTVGLRTWTHSSGRHRVVGSFVARKGDQVQIRREDGGLLDIKVDALSPADRSFVRDRFARIEKVNGVRTPTVSQVGRREPSESEAIAAAFRPFAEAIKTRVDGDFFYVESNGMPDHPLMIGIRAWQQQVPIPQKYVGDNAWRIPVRPVPARNPLSAKDGFFRGAIALAVNGVPIFNPIKNDGRTDTLIAGELDDFGGHCGRADDYHYHVAPVHLEPKTGKGKPLAYALDGYPIYGYDEPDGTPAKGLDRFNGHEPNPAMYHYHATKTYPYLNGGFHGEVVERDGQVDPQPRAESPRPALPPLRGATIVDFKKVGPDAYSLAFEIKNRRSFVNYALGANGSATFEFVDPQGKTRSETYERRGRGPGGDRPPRRGEAPPPPRDEERRPAPLVRALDRDGDGELSAAEIASAAKALTALDRDGDGLLSPEELRPEPPPDDRPEAGRRRPPRGGGPREEAVETGDFGPLVVLSSAFKPGESLPAEFTCDGAGVSPPLEWGEAPKGTKSYAITLWHVPLDGGTKSYWVVYDIPANVDQLPKNAKGVGTVGLNDKKRAAYDPMCSQGPGAKAYHVTVHALSKTLGLPAGRTTRAELLKAMEGSELSRKTLSYVYARGGRG